MIYASVSLGFKAGGFNPADCNDAYGQELLWAYELGYKNLWLDGRLRFNAAAFYYDYNSFQANLLRQIVSAIENASDASVIGIEVEMEFRLSSSLRFRSSGSLQKSQFADFLTREEFFDRQVNLQGNKLPRTPGKSFFAAIEYNPDTGMMLYPEFRGDVACKSGYYFSVFNRASSRQPAACEVNIGMSFGMRETEEGERNENVNWRIDIFARNLFDRPRLITAFDSPTLGGTVVQYGPGRTFGVELRATY
jgi:iron complex outermembrane receptor protein